MDFGVLNEGWVGALLGFIGICLATLFYFRGRMIKRLAYQVRGSHLIGGQDAELPAEVKVTFNGIGVPLLGKTTIILWNDGNTTLQGNDITGTDPLRIEFSDDCQILEAKISKITRPIISFQLVKDPAKANCVICTYDFLDKNDGVKIELLHTSVSNDLKVKGTIRGIPEGCSNLGKIPISNIEINRKSRQFKNGSSFEKFIFYLIISSEKRLHVTMSILGLVIICVGIFSATIVQYFPTLADKSEPIFSPGKPNGFLILLGTFYLIPPLILMWVKRKRFPTKLVD